MASAQTLTNRQIAAGFGVSDITVFNWRQGSPRKAALPSENPSGRSVVFKLQDVKRWAKQHSLVFDEAKALAVVSAPPGPKATSKPTAKALPKRQR